MDTKNKIIFLLAVIAANLQSAEQSQFAQDSDAEMSQAVQAAPTDDLADALLGDEEVKKKVEAENSTKKQLTNNGFLIPGLADSVVERAFVYSLTSFDDIKNLSKVSKRWRDKFLFEPNLIDIIKKIYINGNKLAITIGVQADLVEIMISHFNKLEIANETKLEDAADDEARSKLIKDFDIFKEKMLFDYLKSGSFYNASRIISTILHMNLSFDLATPIYYATLKGHAESARLLIENNPKFNSTKLLPYRENNETLLHVAAKSGKAKMYKLIRDKLFKDSSLDIIKKLFGEQNRAGNTVLHEAILTGNSDLVKEICFEFICNSITDTKNIEANNVLNLAMQKNDFSMAFMIMARLSQLRESEVIKKLFDEKVISQALNNDNDSFINLFLSHGLWLTGEQHFVEAIKKCFSKNDYKLLDLMLLTISPAERSKDVINKSLIKLCSEENKELVNVLIKKFKLSLDKPVNDKGETLLHLAASDLNISAIQFLLKNGAGNSVNMADKDGNTPLFNFAIGNTNKPLLTLRLNIERPDNLKFIEVLNLFLPYNLNINAVNNKGKTILFYLADEALFEGSGVLETLLQNGLNINAVDNDGNSILHEIAAHGCMHGQGEYLIKNGANIEIKNKLGQNPLHQLAALLYGLPSTRWAICRGVYLEPDAECHTDGISTLLKLAPQLIENKDNVGKTPLHYAIERGRTSTVKHLLDNKADIDAKDNKGMSPLHLAVLMNNSSNWGESSLNKVILLLENNCNVHALNNDGKTAYDLAVERQFGLEDRLQKLQSEEHQEIIAMLKSLMN